MYSLFIVVKTLIKIRWKTLGELAELAELIQYIYFRYAWKKLEVK